MASLRHPLSAGVTPNCRGVPSQQTQPCAAGSRSIACYAIKVHETRTLVPQELALDDSLAIRLPQARPPQHATPRHHPSSSSSSGAQDRALSRYLINAIMGAHAWQELAELSQIHSLAFNTVHISALVTRLPKLVHPAKMEHGEKARFARFLGCISDMVSVRLADFDPRAVANVLWAVCKLGYAPAPPLLNKFLFEAYVRMEQFNAQELANLSWALATLEAMGNRPVPVWMRAFTAAALQRVEGLKPQELAHMAWALSKLCAPAQQAGGEAAGAQAAGGSSPSSSDTSSSSTEHAARQPHQHSAHSSASASSSGTGAPGAQPTLPALVAALGEAAHVRLRAFSPGELVMTLLALHRLDPRVGARLLRPALLVLLPRSGELSQQDLANVWSVAMKCCMHEAPGHEKRAARGVYWSQRDGPLDGGGTAGGASSSGDASSDAGRAGQAGLHASVPSSSSHRLTASLPPSSCSAPPPSSSSCSSASSPSSSRARAPGRGRKRSAAAAEADERNGALPGRHQLYALMDATEGHLHGFTVKGICTVLVAWAHLGLKPSAAVMRLLFARLAHVLPAQSTFQVTAVVLWACARLGVRPPQEVAAALLRFGKLQMAAASATDVVALAYALQELRYRPPRSFFAALTHKLEGGLLRKVRPHGLHALLTLYGAYGYTVPPAVRRGALLAMVDGAQAAGPAAQEPAAPPAASAAGVAPVPAPPAPASLVASTPAPSSSSSSAHAAAPPRGPQGGSWGRSAATAVRFLANLCGVSTRNMLSADSAYTMRRRLRFQVSRTRGVYAHALAAVERDTCGRMHTLSADALCALAVAAARLRMRPSAPFLDELQRQAQQRGDTLMPWQAAALLRSVALLDAKPPAAWVHGMLCVMAPGLSDMTGRQLLSVLRALRTLRYRPAVGWLSLYFTECMGRINEWPTRHVHSFLSGLAALGLTLGSESKSCKQLQLVVKKRKLGKGWTEGPELRGVMAKGAPRSRRRGRGADKRVVISWGVAKSSPAAKEVQQLRRAADKGAKLDLSAQLCRLCQVLEGCAVE